MLMLDRADSHGVFVRPRPGRLELCGEHATGARLGAGAALVVGGARACAAALAGGVNGLPPVLAVATRPATGRQGLFVGRNSAFGFDLHAAGRQAELPLESGGTISAQAHLVLAWECAQAVLGRDAGVGDLAHGDAMVSGSAPLGIEVRVTEALLPPAAVPTSPFGDMLAPRRRPGFEVAAVAATWDFTVFGLTGTGRQAYACVPGHQLGTFLDRLDAGLLDGLLTDFIEAGPTGSALVAHEQTAEPALWDEVVVGPDLLPYERSAADVDREAATYVAPAMVTAVRPVPGQPTSNVAPAPVPRPLPVAGKPRRRRRAPVLAGVIMVLVLAGLAAAVTGVFGGGTPAGVDLVSGAAPSTLAGNATTPPAREPVATTVPPLSSAGNQPAAPPSAPGPVPTTLPAATRPGPTAAVQTTVAPDTSVPVTATTATTSSTTTTTPPPTSVTVTITSGILGCAFQPASASAVRGSTVRFRNDAGTAITVVIVPPGGSATTLSLDAGGSSGGYSLDAAGAYAVTCTPGGDGQVGRMTITGS